MKKAAIMVAALVITLVQLAEQRSTAQLSVGTGQTSTAAKVDPLIVNHFQLRDGLKPIPVVITYKAMPSSSDLNRLQLAGITKGIKMRELPMVIAPMNAAQLASVKTQPGVKSIWANRIMKPFTNESRRFIGVPQMMADRDVQLANYQNPGMPISGKGVGIGYIDTGIDATHADLKYGTKTVQNVIQPHSETTVGDGGLLIGIGLNVFDEAYVATGFNPPIYVENQQHSDVESGHGTHGAAVAAGTGQQSGNFYGGVAPGANLIGLNAGNELGLPLVTILRAYDYLLVNQFTYNVRIINNSWGSSLSPEGISPDDPINIATREAHDRNIVVVFAAGNGIDSVGDVPGAINPYSTMPWTISVAAGEKRGLGTPTSFSSRGEQPCPADMNDWPHPWPCDDGTGTDVAGQPADPNAKPNLRPDITAPGADIKSARMKGAGLTNTIGAIPLFVGANDLSTIPPALLPYYTTSRGTSFACPHVSGVVALMLEADPTLTPDQVITILRETANPMPYTQRVVGAGYVDAHNAVRRVMGLSAVNHPFNLFPQPGPEIVDPVGDQYFSMGVPATGAQDIISVDYSYDAGAGQIVYTTTVANLAQRQPNNQWTVSSNFGSTTVYVSARVGATGAITYQYGKIAPDPTNGVPTQTSLGAAQGETNGNQIIIRLPVSSINTAVGTDIVGTTSTVTDAKAQVLIGVLLFAADLASGADFKVE